MKTVMELIREEFCSRYGLNPEQIDIDVRITEVSKELSEQIGKDYGNKYENTENYFMGTKCGHVYNEEFVIYTHFPNEEGDDLEIDL
jgi:hypothetical protein